MHKFKLNRLLFIASVLTLTFAVACGKNKLDSNSSTSNNTSGGSPQATGCSTNCKIFVSATTTEGNFGSIAAADSICANDANKPAGGGTYKAMVVKGTDRRACSTDNCSGGIAEHIDWVLKANTSYYKTDGTTLIGITNSNGLLGNTVSQAIGDGGSNVWTGITYRDANPMFIFMSAQRWLNSGSDCSGWSDNTSNNAGQVGQMGVTNFNYIDAGNPVCSNQYSFYCVEQ
jgi:hypothetical protein